MAKITYGKEIKGYVVNAGSYPHFNDLVKARVYAAKQSIKYLNEDSATIVYIDKLVPASNGYTCGVGAKTFGWVLIRNDKLIWRAPNKKDSRYININGEIIGKIPSAEMRYL